MGDLFAVLLLGAASGALGVVACRWRLPWLSWLALAPLAAATYLGSPPNAGLAGAVCGALLVAGDRLTSIPKVVRGASLLEAAMALGHALVWGVAFGVAGWLWPDGVPAWGVVVVPLAVLLIAMEYRLGSPRWSSWFHASQAGCLPAVHIARLGTDLVIPVLLGLAAAVPAVLLVQLPPRWPTLVAAGAAVVVVAGAVMFGVSSSRRAVARADRRPRVRVAAVAAEPPDLDPKSPGYRDIDALIAGYEPLLSRAVAEHAQLVVLPEGAAVVSEETRATWLGAVCRWAREAKAPVVAGLSQDLKTNEVVIADETGVLRVDYEKQHPAFFGEPKPHAHTPPGALFDGPFPVSAVVCVDSDYSDLNRRVARTGGVLAVPTNDWEEIYQAQLRVAVRPAVLTGVPVVRSTGHGVSAVLDGAGHTLAQASSEDGPVVLICDVPLGETGARQ